MTPPPVQTRQPERRMGNRMRARLPLPLAAFLSPHVLWVAENIGTATGTWLCSGPSPDHWVSFGKIGSWSDKTAPA